MALVILTIIFYAGGLLAILYAVLALLSMLKYSRAQKALPEKFEPEAGTPATIGPPLAEAYCQRALILLKNEQFEAALADCKRAIDINPKHAEANTLWQHALEREIPPEPAAEAVVETVAEPVPPTAEAEPALRKVKKVVKRIRRRKKAAPEPVAEEKARETGEAEEIAAVKPAAEPVKEAEVVLEPLPEEEISAAEEPPAAPEEPETAEPAAAEALIELEAEAEIEPVAEEEPGAEIEAEAEVVSEPFPAEEISVAEEPPVELKEPEAAEPAEEEAPIALEAEVEIEPAPEPEISAELEEEIPAAREPLPGEEEGPLIPQDKLVTPKPSRESLLEEFDHEKLRDFEQGEATAEDAEWTRFADKQGPELGESKIDMNELPATATGLKETLIDLRQAEAYNLQGETSISKNLFNNAIKDFSRALEINPNYVDALINRGSAYAQLGRFNDALMDFNHALKFEKKDAELYNKRGEIYLQNNMYDQAIKDFTAAMVLNPMYSDAYLNRGRAYSEKGMPEEAMADFNQAIKADSDQSFGFIDRAAPEIHTEEESGANSEEAATFNRQGLADLKGEKYKEAVENFTQAISLSSSDAEGYINRGRAYIKLGKPDAAMKDFSKAVLFDPLNASLYYWRAQAWKAKDDEFNTNEDLKLSCELGYEPACLEYRKRKTTKK